MGNWEGKVENFAKVMPISPEQGAATSVYASFDPDLKSTTPPFPHSLTALRVHSTNRVLGDNGKYLLQCRLSDPFIDTVKPWATSPAEAERLWKVSEEIVGQKFSY